MHSVLVKEGNALTSGKHNLVWKEKMVRGSLKWRRATMGRGNIHWGSESMNDLNSGKQGGEGAGLETREDTERKAFLGGRRADPNEKTEGLL